MAKETEQKESSGVDKGLVAMFLKMSPEERLLANDNMVRTILEFRNAYEDLLEQTVEIEFRGHLIRVLNFGFSILKHWPNSRKHQEILKTNNA